VETGSTSTACATTQSPQSLIMETLHENPTYAGPIRRAIFDIQPPPRGILI